jgi:hypothetical protein
VALTLVNENKAPVIPYLYYYPDQPDFLIQTSIILDDKRLATGTYQVMVVASDGTNTKHKYRDIRVNEIPQTLLGYITVSAPLSFLSTITRFNTAFETDTQFVIPQAHKLSGVHSLWGDFFFVSDKPSVMTAYNSTTFSVGWELAAAPPRPLITGIFPDKELVFSTDNGDAGILSASGMIIMRTPALQTRSVRCLAADENFIYAAHVSLGGDLRELTVFYRVSGFIRDQKLHQGEIRSLFPAGEKLYVFLQTSSGIDIKEYDPETLSMTQVKSLPGESLVSAEKISDKQIFLLTDSRVVSYDPYYNQINGFVGQAFDLCRYEQLSDIIYLVRGNTVFGYGRASGNFLNEKVIDETILDFQILYNK